MMFDSSYPIVFYANVKNLVYQWKELVEWWCHFKENGLEYEREV